MVNAIKETGYEVFIGLTEGKALSDSSGDAKRVKELIKSPAAKASTDEDGRTATDTPPEITAVEIKGRRNSQGLLNAQNTIPWMKGFQEIPYTWQRTQVKGRGWRQTFPEH